LAHRLSLEAPGVRLRLVDSSFGEVERLLQDNVIDLALERPLTVGDWISSEALFDSDFVVVASSRDPELASVKPGKVMPVELFCSLRHAIRSTDGSLSGLIDEALASQGLARRVVLGLANFHSVALAVARGGLVAALPRQFFNAVGASMGLTAYELPVESPRPVIRAYWHSRHDRNPAHRWLRGVAGELSREIGAL
jgi:DNA-binding transcriptional LysR family regulator